VRRGGAPRRAQTPIDPVRAKDPNGSIAAARAPEPIRTLTVAGAVDSVWASVNKGLAAAVLVVWGLGVELGPGLHVAFHDLLEHHHHDGQPHGDHHEDDDDDPDHGSQSLAHRQLAILGAAPPPRIPPLEVVDIVSAAAPRAQRPRSRSPECVRQRGPPDATGLLVTG
jgi:hypothetical protein